MSAQATHSRYFSVVHITPPDKRREDEYDELRTDFQIVLTLLRHQRLSRDAFSAVALFLSFSNCRRAVRRHRSFHFRFTEGDEIVRQQLGTTALVVAVSPAPALRNLLLLSRT